MKGRGLSAEPVYTVLDPRSCEPEVDYQGLTSRLDTLEGKKVAVINLGGGNEEVMESIAPDLEAASVLGIAHLTERVRPGVIHAYEGSAKYDPVEPGKPGSIDRGGCVNLLTTDRMMSQNAPGFAPNSCLIEISKFEV